MTENLLFGESYYVTDDCFVKKQEKYFDKMCEIHERMLEERRAEMVLLKDWMESMKDNEVQMTNTIRTMVDVLSKRLAITPGPICPQCLTKCANANFQYAGIYFVHN